MKDTLPGKAPGAAPGSARPAQGPAPSRTGTPRPPTRPPCARQATHGHAALCSSWREDSISEATLSFCTEMWLRRRLPVGLRTSCPSHSRCSLTPGCFGAPRASTVARPAARAGTTQTWQSSRPCELGAPCSISAPVRSRRLWPLRPREPGSRGGQAALGLCCRRDAGEASVHTLPLPPRAQGCAGGGRPGSPEEQRV